MLLTAQIDVGVAPAPLTTADQDGHGAVIVKNIGGETLWIGPDGVTPATGFPLEPGEAFPADVGGQLVYGVTASGTTRAAVLEVNR